MSIKILLSAVILLIVTFQTTQAQTSSKSDTLTTIAGKWAGTYSGDASGKFELVLNQDNSKKLTGQITMIADNGNQQTTNLKTISWQNGQLSATYKDPAEDDDVSFTGSYTNAMLKGTWKSDGGQATGTWQLTR
ncbi:hypothetical protein BH09BAC4_BH09BAC4_17260 [soil metagenome]